MRGARQEQVSGIQSRALSSLSPPSLSLERGLTSRGLSGCLSVSLPLPWVTSFLSVLVMLQARVSEGSVTEALWTLRQREAQGGTTVMVREGLLTPVEPYVTSQPPPAP